MLCFVACTANAVFSHDDGEVHAFEDFVLILAVAVFVSFYATRRLPVLPIPLPAARGERRNFVRALLAASLGSLPKEIILGLTSVGQGFGLPLRSVSAARNTHITILELPLQR